MEAQGKNARSTVSVEENTLSTILDLVGQHDWLKPKSDTLASLLSECESPAESDLVVHLLTKFRYFDSYDFNAAITHALPKIEEDWSLSPANTVFSTLARDESLDSGAIFLSGARNRLADDGWKKDHFKPEFYSIDFAAEKWIEKVVLCDDFTGTGNTLSRKATWLRKKLAGIDSNVSDIYFFGLACMEFSVPVVEKVVDDYHFCELLKKGISDHFKGEKLKQKMAASETMEGRLQNPKKVKEFSMGYKQSESLYSLQDTNIPNNVFPILWWRKLVGGIPRNPIFRRVT